jgi:2-keto-3-deoxy-L-rhamnonate aldolase RhmA
MKARIGTFLSIGSPALAELAAECGFDWVLIDLEHGCASEAALPDQLRALRGSQVIGIVRVGAPHPDLIGRVLDWGAHGVMVPHVNTAAEAEHCVRAASYPPQGRRGVARTVRAHGYGLRPIDDSSSGPVILAQIETVEGVENVAAIAAVPGISALFIGPADLSFDLKARQSKLGYDDCLVRVLQSARDHGKGCGILVRHSDDLSRLRTLGFDWLAVDSDLSLVREGFRRNLEKARN